MVAIGNGSLREKLGMSNSLHATTSYVATEHLKWSWSKVGRPVRLIYTLNFGDLSKNKTKQNM